MNHLSKWSQYKTYGIYFGTRVHAKAWTSNQWLMILDGQLIWIENHQRTFSVEFGWSIVYGVLYLYIKSVIVPSSINSLEFTSNLYPNLAQTSFKATEIGKSTWNVWDNSYSSFMVS